MSGDTAQVASQAAGAILQAYAAEAKPPLTQELTARLHALLADTLHDQAGGAP